MPAASERRRLYRMLVEGVAAQEEGPKGVTVGQVGLEGMEPAEGKVEDCTRCGPPTAAPRNCFARRLAAADKQRGARPNRRSRTARS